MLLRAWNERKGDWLVVISAMVDDCVVCDIYDSDRMRLLRVVGCAIVGHCSLQVQDHD